MDAATLPAGSRQGRLTRARPVSSEPLRSGKAERAAPVPRHCGEQRFMMLDMTGRPLCNQSLSETGSKNTSLQVASARQSTPARSSPVITSAHTVSGAVCALTFCTERLSPKPPQASISRHKSSHKSAHAHVLASVAFRPRWLTPCSTKLLSVTYCASARNSEEHEEGEELCSVYNLGWDTAAVQKPRRAARLLCLPQAPHPPRGGQRLVPRRLSHLRRQLS